MLIDAIVKNGSSASPGADHVPPPPGWRDEDIGRSETFNTSSDEKKTYTEEQRHGVSRCKMFTLFHHNRLTVCAPCAPWCRCRLMQPEPGFIQHLQPSNPAPPPQSSCYAYVFAGLRTVRTFTKFWAFPKMPAKKIWRERTGSWLWSFTPTRTSLRELQTLSKVAARAAAHRSRIITHTGSLKVWLLVSIFRSVRTF